MSGAAAFFDLDRTLLRRSSALALAKPFRERGLIHRRQLAKAAFVQLLFTARGANADAVRKMTEGGLRLLRGLSPDEMRELVATAMEPTLRPLVYREALAVAGRHRELGERCFIVSATLQEIAEGIAAELGFDGAIGSVCEVEGGVFSGRTLRACHGPAKAGAVRELAATEAIDLSRSTAYSDSDSDLPLLEAVGRPVAVNPDRGLRRIARERGWPVVRWREQAFPRAA